LEIEEMRTWFSRLTGRRLKPRFRRAGMAMMLPLAGLAAVSGAGLVVTSNTSVALDRAQQLTSQVAGLEASAQSFGFNALNVLVGHGSADVTTMSASENDVDADFRTLAAQTGLTADQVNALSTADAEWKKTSAYRVAIRRLRQSGTVDPTRATALASYLDSDLSSLIDRLTILETSGAAIVLDLQQSRDAAIRSSAIAVAIALAAGMSIAIWSTSRLARSVLRPLGALNRATARLAAGDLRHRIAGGRSDEIGDLGQAFDKMADQLEQERDAVRARERRLAALVENASDAILVVGTDGAIGFATPLFREFVDSAGDAVPRLTDIVHPDDVGRFNAAWNRGMAEPAGSTLEVEARLKHRDGSWRHVWARLTNRFDDPAVAGMVLNISDISERHEHEKQLTFQALHDPLTGLPNRELLRQRTERSAAAAGQGSRVDSVLYIDLDDFKRINDTFGHQGGDKFLVAVAQRLVAAVRPQDTVARLGGDEFAVLLEGTTSQAAAAVTERLLSALQEPYFLDGKGVVAPGASVGIASSTRARVNAETLLGDADLAMYFAKRSGKGQYRVFTQAMRVDRLDRLQLGDELRAAIEAGTIEVHYQPIVDMQSGVIVGAEALARWPHPLRGWVAPAVFMALAEELHLAERIDAFVLHQACLQAGAWGAAGLPLVRIAVNLSSSNLGRPDFVLMVASTLQDTGFPAGSLELDLSEGALIADSSAVVVTLDKLKALGVQLAVNDFGAGNSALSRLRALPVDILKVHKVFIDELGAATPGSTLAEHILGIARALQLNVVAAGVETASQADFLREHGCDRAQGQLFSRAVEPEAFAALLAGGAALGVIKPEPAMA
jgi:diguanylate cyclase (GGDEF)-like protein/PAS domain S-box-containing protein